MIDLKTKGKLIKDIDKMMKNDDEKVCAEASNEKKKWLQERSSGSFSVANCFR